MLCGLDAAGAAALVCGHFPRDVSRALQSLAPTPKLQFAFLDALMATADDAVSGGRDASRTFVNVGDDERSLYVHLLCDFAPDRVYDYLTSHDGYDRDECLDLCRARGTGQQKGAKLPTSKARISVVCHPLWLTFGRVIVSRRGLEARTLFLERARAD